MPGRAPTMTSDEGWSPSRILSSSWYPVATPVSASPRLPSSSMRSNPLTSNSLSGAMVSAVRRSATSKIVCSASSTAASTSSGTEYPMSAMSPAAPMSLRSSACSSTMVA